MMVIARYPLARKFLAPGAIWPISPVTKSIDTLRGYVRMRRCFRIILVRLL